MIALKRNVFTRLGITKGDKEIETVGMMSKEDLDAKLNSFK